MPLYSARMTNLLILAEVQEAMRTRYKVMLLERFPQLTINVAGHHNLVDPYIADTDMLLCFSPPMADHVVRDAKKLKWIQALGTGVDNIVDLPSLGKEVLVTNIRGIHGPPVSEATIAYMLSLARDLPRSTRAQDRSDWERWPAQLLDGKTVGILGVGLIAEYLAPICKHFGMTVIGISGTPRPAKGFDRMVARNDLLKVAPRARLPGGAGAADAGNARHHRREGVRRHEADRPIWSMSRAAAWSTSRP